jgi:hypothetical protein
MGTIRDEIQASYRKQRHKHDGDPDAIKRFLPFSDDEIDIMCDWRDKAKLHYEFTPLYETASNLTAELRIEKLRRQGRSNP